MFDIQLYARLADLIFTEGPIIPRSALAPEAWEPAVEETGCPTLNAAEYFPKFMEESLKYGVPDFSLQVHRNGIIGDGNFRGHWGRWAQMKFLPVDLEYFLCGSSRVWRETHPYTGRGSAGKKRTILHLPRYLSKGFHSWWKLEARDFLQPFIRFGNPPPEFNLSYAACKERLQQ